MQDLLTLDDIMVRYKLQRHAAANLMHKMPVTKIGRRLFVTVRDLEKWEQEQTQYPAGLQTPGRVVKIQRRRATS